MTPDPPLFVDGALVWYTREAGYRSAATALPPLAAIVIGELRAIPPGHGTRTGHYYTIRLVDPAVNPRYRVRQVAGKALTLRLPASPQP